MLKRIFLISLLIFSLNSCANFGRSRITPELKIALIGVCGEYLDKVNNSRFDVISGMIVWESYLSEDKQLDKLKYAKQVAASRLYWKETPDKHPLVNLDLKDINLRGNDATVKFQKYSDKDSPVIEIELHWTGQGWLVVDDNIFGRGRLMDKLIREKT